ncbi:MAG: glutamate synthase subunit beta [Clostridiaceae bacterium]|jgi:glutamate synthase (NADPH/NADH) small chain|nr:glutamate synthase subunit beta [Clostridiaceae bacterium]
MGDPNGFLTVKRMVAPDRTPLDRIGDWQDFHTALPCGEQERQGSRCMNCGIPFCQAGVLVKGAASGCPLHNLMPEWNDLIWRGQWQAAWLRLMKTNNFPEFTGRVCPAPCEGACTAGLNDFPVAIKANECAIIDRAWAEGWMQSQPPARRTGKKVAIIGSGPAGLACADQLNKAGHQVIVFERADRPGGLLTYGIPNMKLDKAIVARRISQLASEGIVFRTGCDVGRDIPAQQVRKTHDAVVLCGGATRPRDLAVPGRGLNGIHFAVDYLTASTRWLLDGHQAGRPAIDARGLDVVVIGGGDTGTDCVATAIRQGCRSVRQLEIMPKAPETRSAQNPWPQWPAIRRTDYGQEEAIGISGADPRSYLTTALACLNDGRGRVGSLETARVSWVSGSQGRLTPVPVSGSEQTVPAQLVLLAMGFLGPEQTTLDELQLARDARSQVQTGEGTYQTSLEGVFAAGDMRRGQSLVVWAIQEGRAAARACDIWLSGASLLPG